MRIVTIPMSGGLPVIPEAALIKKEGNSGWYSAHFAPVNRLWVMLFEFESGRFLVDPVDSDLLKHLPNGTAWNRRAWNRWRVEASADEEAVGRVVRMTTVPGQDASNGSPWTGDGVTFTRATPVLPTACGHVVDVELGNAP